MKNKRALSLLESIIGIAIFSALLTICALILNRALIASSHARARSVIGNEAMKSISWLISDLSRTSAASLTVAKGGTIIDPNSLDPNHITGPVDITDLCFLTGNTDSSLDMEYTTEFPLVKWRSYVIYSLTPDKGNLNFLKRATYFNNSENVFKLYIPSPLAFIPGGASVDNDRTVARNIYNLQILEFAGNRCTLKVTAKENTKGGVLVESTQTFTVVMKNTVKCKFK